MVRMYVTGRKAPTSAAGSALSSVPTTQAASPPSSSGLGARCAWGWGDAGPRQGHLLHFSLLWHLTLCLTLTLGPSCPFRVSLSHYLGFSLSHHLHPGLLGLAVPGAQSWAGADAGVSRLCPLRALSLSTRCSQCCTPSSGLLTPPATSAPGCTCPRPPPHWTW